MIGRTSLRIVIKLLLERRGDELKIYHFLEVRVADWRESGNMVHVQ